MEKIIFKQMLAMNLYVSVESFDV